MDRLKSGAADAVTNIKKNTLPVIVWSNLKYILEILDS